MANSPWAQVARAGRDADVELVRSLLAGKPEAFHRFFERWLPPVYAHAQRSTGRSVEAEALTERILARLLAELPGWDGSVPLERFVLAVAVLAEDATPPAS